MIVEQSGQAVEMSGAAADAESQGHHAQAERALRDVSGHHVGGGKEHRRTDRDPARELGADGGPV